MEGNENELVVSIGTSHSCHRTHGSERCRQQYYASCDFMIMCLADGVACFRCGEHKTTFAQHAVGLALQPSRLPFSDTTETVCFDCMVEMLQGTRERVENRMRIRRQAESETAL